MAPTPSDDHHQEKNSHLVYDIKLSTVVPGSITAENKTHPLKNMDLAMKLHYLRAIYFFDKDEAIEGLNVYALKNPMSIWLRAFNHLAGRIRTSSEDDDGKLTMFIKCNDSGVRVVEAKCGKSIEEWVLGSRENDHLLFYDHVLGPDLGFSPLVFVQFTWFKCGGISIGLSWSHILGDAFSASEFINQWGHFMSGSQHPSKVLAMEGPKTHKSTLLIAKKPHSVKSIDPVGDQWLISSHQKLQVFSTNVTAKQLNNLLSNMAEEKLKPFALISAMIWRSLAKIRGENETKIVTICRNDASYKRTGEIQGNSQVISTVEAGVKVGEANLIELAELIANEQVDERGLIEELIENNEGKSDFIVYGAKLTFVDFEGAEIYGLELKGHKPIFANYYLSGVGDEGVVMVLPARYNGAKREGGGRVVNFILPKNEVEGLKDQLRKEWGIF